jgi:hypothetical protein
MTKLFRLAVQSFNAQSAKEWKDRTRTLRITCWVEARTHKNEPSAAEPRRGGHNRDAAAVTTRP